MLHLELGSRESYDSCLSFIRDMVHRGLRTPVLVTTDGAPGLIRAVEEVWGKSLRQHCLAHTPAWAAGAREMRNILDKVPRAAREEIKRRVRDVFYAPTLETARDRAAEVLREFEKRVEFDGRHLVTFPCTADTYGPRSFLRIRAIDKHAQGPNQKADHQPGLYLAQ